MKHRMAWVVVVALVSGCVGPRHAGSRSALGALWLAADIAEAVSIHNARAERRAERQAAEDEWAAQQQAYEASLPHDPGVLQATTAGFYCARSASHADVSLCARDHAACDEDRDEAMVSLPDFGACAAAAHAWCLLGHCYADEASCARRLVPGTVGQCEELQ